MGSVSEDDIFVVLKKGEELIDPDTGLSPGGEMEPVGKIKIHSVKEKYSIADEIDIDASQIDRGDVVESANPVIPMQFAKQWQKSAKTSKSENSGKSTKSNKSLESAKKKLGKFLGSIRNGVPKKPQDASETK